MTLNKKLIAACSVSAVIALTINLEPDMRTSQAGLEIIGGAESCRQEPYRCPAGFLTVGIGSTAQSGQVIEPRRYSLEEIAQRFGRDIKQAEQCVNRYANGKNQPQGAFDALVSITFNVGCGKLRSSTLFKLAQQGYSPAMCQQLDRWIYANGKKLTGLVKRRAQEKALCLQGAGNVP